MSASGAVIRGLIIAFSMTLIALLSPTQTADARTFYVEDTADTDDDGLNDNECKAQLSFGSILKRCTFRAAMQQANASSGADVIVLEAKRYKISPGSTPCNDSAGVLILGSGPGETILDRDGTGAGFTCSGPIEMRDVTITNGSGPSFTISSTSSLTLNAVFVVNNTAGANQFAGAINLNGPAVIRNSTFSNNRSTSGTSNAGAVFQTGSTLTIENSTFNNNSATGSQAAGAIFTRLSGQLNILNSTFSANQGEFAGAIFVETGIAHFNFSTFVNNVPFSLDRSAGQLISEGSIYSTNSGNNCHFTVQTAGNPARNFDSGGSCGFNPATNTNGAILFLESLAANGGASATHATIAVSPPVDAILAPSSCPSADQRGSSRPVDGNSDGIILCDSGSFERRSGFRGSLGIPSLSPGSGTVGVDQTFTETFAWDVPAPSNWLALGTLDLRLRDQSGAIVFWVRWDQVRDEFRLIDAAGVPSGVNVPGGVDVPLARNGVTLNLAAVRALGSGPNGQRATLTLPFQFDQSFAGRTLGIEVSAQDDDGNQDPFTNAGTISITSSSSGDLNKDDDPHRLTAEGRLQKKRTSRAGLGDEHTEGDVLAARCGPDVNEVDIANVDGRVTVLLLHDARTLCQYFLPGHYATFDGVKVHEQLFEAHEGSID